MYMSIFFWKIVWWNFIFFTVLLLGTLWKIFDEAFIEDFNNGHVFVFTITIELHGTVIYSYSIGFLTVEQQWNKFFVTMNFPYARQLQCGRQMKRMWKIDLPVHIYALLLTKYDLRPRDKHFLRRLKRFIEKW